MLMADGENGDVLLKEESAALLIESILEGMDREKSLI